MRFMNAALPTQTVVPLILAITPSPSSSWASLTALLSSGLPKLP